MTTFERAPGHGREDSRWTGIVIGALAVIDIAALIVVIGTW